MVCSGLQPPETGPETGDIDVAQVNRLVTPLLDVPSRHGLVVCQVPFPWQAVGVVSVVLTGLVVRVVVAVLPVEVLNRHDPFSFLLSVSAQDVVAGGRETVLVVMLLVEVLTGGEGPHSKLML